MFRTILLVAFLIALVFSGLVGGQAVAEVIDGSKLFADCRDGDNPNARDSTYKWGTCFGYINGVADALVPAGLYCLPTGRSPGKCSTLPSSTSKIIRTSDICLRLS